LQKKFAGKVMEKFIEKYGEKIIGTQHGFDRIIIKGYIRDFYIDRRFHYFLNHEGCLLKDYNKYVISNSQEIKKRVDSIEQETKCYREFLSSPSIDKEKIAKEILSKDPEKEGLLCILSVTETSQAITVRGNKQTKLKERRCELRRCTHYYFYYNDREFGLMHVRLQSWLPYTIQIYINGKEYLKKQLDKKGIKYQSYNNSITYLKELEEAQKISNRLIEKKWYEVFDSFVQKINPIARRIENILGRVAYSWCIDECEYATDILFKDRETLARLFPRFVEYASLCQVGENIFTFFGRKLNNHYMGEVVSRKKNYQQGFCVKFMMDKNWLKMYDKYSVLRIEITINNSRAFKVRKQGKWLPMGKSISNMYRIAEVAQKCNERYLDSLAILDCKNDLEKEIESLCNSKITKLSGNNANARPYGAFNLLKDFTCKLFNTLMNGAYNIKGFTRKGITEALIKLKAFSPSEMSDMKKLLGKVTRLLSKLRAHGLITRYPKTFKYRVTQKGQEIISRILLFKKMDLWVGLPVMS
jgi:hypothetical protein